MFTQNVKFKKRLKLSSWRKAAIATWGTTSGAQVFSTLDINVEPALAYIEKHKESGTRVTLTHLAGAVVAKVIDEHPYINCILRFGELYQRESIDIFFQVVGNDKNLSGYTVREANTKTMVDMAKEMGSVVGDIKTGKDEEYQKIKNSLDPVPSFFVRPIIILLGFFMYGLNLWHKALGVPRDSFGSIMITNVGSLGLDGGYAPLVPYSRCPAVMVLGSINDKAIVVDGEIKIQKQISTGWTMDHRVIDGIHGAEMARTFKKYFLNPDLLDE